MVLPYRWESRSSPNTIEPFRMSGGLFLLCPQGSLRFTPGWHRSGFQPFWERGSIKNADISARILCFVNYKFYYSAFPFFFIQKYMPQ